jgi:DNA-binding MarR family transcriptional regulator
VTTARARPGRAEAVLGYLERRPDPDDRRARRIALTDRGKSLVPVIREAVSEVEREWAAALGAERFAQLRELLVELNTVELNTVELSGVGED